MVTGPGFLRLNRLRILQQGRVVYDQGFHKGVNIIRGQNGSGKSTIADFIFFILGGEFDSWKDAASRCDEAQAEVETPRGKLTLKRQTITALEPLFVYFGAMSVASTSSLEGWERFPVRRHGGRESFSQVMFRSILIPEARSEGAANITMHQMLRLCYSDQRTPAARLFRFERFDTQNIRDAVGSLICGVDGYESYEIVLQLRELQKQIDRIEARLQALGSAVLTDPRLDTPDLIVGQIDNLKKERTELERQLVNVDRLVEPREVDKYLSERLTAQRSLMRERKELSKMELKVDDIQFELREIGEFVRYLTQLKEKLQYAEETFVAVGSIEFTHCPACGQKLASETEENHCILCSAPLDPEKERSRYNQIRLDLEIQTRESSQLLEHKRSELVAVRKELRRRRQKHKSNLSTFNLKYSSSIGPREAFLAARTKRLGHIDAEVEFLLNSLETVEEIARLASVHADVSKRMKLLEVKNDRLRQEGAKRRSRALSQISSLGADILRSDLPRQSEFMNAGKMEVDFRNDSIAVDGRVNFAESSNVILKNSAVLALFLAASTDSQYNHPRFLLIDNIEDKGMEEARSHLFQHSIVERASKLKLPYQIIFTTSMMSAELESDDYTIGPPYTSKVRCLELG